MRSLTLLTSILLLSAVALGQNAERGVPGYYPYGCGPFVPMLTTPMVSFSTISPNPVGASNATGGLIAGATNSTLSEVNGNTDAVYTEPVWNSGGGLPLISPAVNSSVGGMNMIRRSRQPAPRQREEKMQPWIYFSSAEPGVHALESASTATGVQPAKHAYTNQDIQQINEQNGTVHYDSKTEKIQ